MTVNNLRPPYDPHVQEVFDTFFATIDPTLRPETILAERERALSYPEDLTCFDVERQDHPVTSYDSAAIIITVFTPRGLTGTAPCIYAIHGGGMVMGDRLMGISSMLPWALNNGAILTTIEYRLAPEHPDPTPVEDCYAGLLWVEAHATEFNIDPQRIIVAGGSAGGGLAAGITLLARDRNGPAIAGQLLLAPMLDDRDATTSTQQFDGIGLWNRASNLTGWNALLGDRRGTPDVSIYAAPARATDLTHLPPTYIDVASAEVFRDECVQFASGLWRDGGTAELHVWPGGTHGYDLLSPQSAIAQGAEHAREKWLARHLK